MPKSTTVCNKFLALLYNATTWDGIAENDSTTPLTNIYMGLQTAPMTGASVQTTSETAYTNYARQAVARTTSGWTAPSSGATANVAAVEFPQCGVTGSTITDAHTGTSVSGGGEIFHYGTLNASIAVSNQVQPRFAAGTVTITEA